MRRVACSERLGELSVQLLAVGRPGIIDAVAARIDDAELLQLTLALWLGHHELF